MSKLSYLARVSLIFSSISEMHNTVPEPIWINVKKFWQILLQHQSTFLGGPESASIENSPFTQVEYINDGHYNWKQLFWLCLRKIALILQIDKNDPLYNCAFQSSLHNVFKNCFLWSESCFTMFTFRGTFTK